MKNQIRILSVGILSLMLQIPAHARSQHEQFIGYLSCKTKGASFTTVEGHTFIKADCALLDHADNPLGPKYKAYLQVTADAISTRGTMSWIAYAQPEVSWIDMEGKYVMGKNPNELFTANYHLIGEGFEGTHGTLVKNVEELTLSSWKKGAR